MAKKKPVAKKAAKTSKPPKAGASKKAAAPRVTGIGGVFFRAKTPKKTQAWYAKHLGVPIDADGYSSFRWREAGPGGGPAMTVWAPFDRDTSYFGKSGQEFMINYRVNDLVGLLSALDEEGVKVAPEREDGALGRFAWIIDPDGRRVELWEPPKGH